MFIIIGAGNGLGRNIAQSLCTKYPLMLSGKTKDNLQETKDLILKNDPNSKILVEEVDLREVASIDEFIKKMKLNSNFKFRGLINTAASFYKGEFKYQSIDSINELIKTNFSNVIYLISQMVRLENLSKPFDIINITSIAAGTNLDTSRSSSIHISTKSALHTFDKILGRELIDDGIRLTSIAPGTFARKGRVGIEEKVICNIIQFLIDLPAQAWIESIDVRPTGK